MHRGMGAPAFAQAVGSMDEAAAGAEELGF
jgi:hypothetical protein